MQNDEIYNNISVKVKIKMSSFSNKKGNFEEREKKNSWKYINDDM